MHNVALARAKELQPGFELDENMKPAFERLVLYFTNSPLFEEKGFGSLKKGLFVLGNIGTGKTLLMRAFQSNPKTRFRFISCSELVGKFQIDGMEGVERYFGRPNQFDADFGIATSFDDLGAENPNANYMGNRTNVMEEIILSRYQNSQPHYYSHFTTNLSGEEIEKIYGARVRSRLREMCNTIILPGSDRRK